MLVRSCHWTLVQAKRILKRWRDANEAVARGLARRQCRAFARRVETRRCCRWRWRFRHGCRAGPLPTERALSWRCASPKLTNKRISQAGP